MGDTAHGTWTSRDLGRFIQENRPKPSVQGFVNLADYFDDGEWLPCTIEAEPHTGQYEVTLKCGAKYLVGVGRLRLP